MKVLFLDDEAKARELMRDLLALDGCEVCLAETPGEAEVLLEREAPDLAISDIHLAGDCDGGLNFAQRAHERFPEVPVILVTGYASMESAVSAVRSRVFDYLTKPIDHDRLRRVMQEALRWRAKALERRALLESAERLQDHLKEEESQLEARLARQEHMASLGYLASGIVHDLASPLSICLLDVQEQRAHSDDPVLAHLESALQYMGDLLRSLADYARSEDQATTARAEIGQVVQSTLRLMEREAKRRQVVLAFEAGASAGLRVPSAAVQEMLVNLVKNAVQVSPLGGRVVVLLAKEGERVSLAVQDEGPGIAPELESRIFEPFFSQNVGPKGDGSGLGLFMVRRIAERLGVGICIQRPEGGGTEIQLLFSRDLFA